MSNNMEKMITMIIVIIIALLIGGLAFKAYRSGKETADTAQNEISNFNTTLLESKYTDYEGRTVLGNEVVSFLNSNANTEIAIQIVTASGSNKIYNYASIDMTGDPTDSQTNNTAISEAKKKGSATYINPNGKFECTLNRDANSTITGIIFTQK